MRSIKTELEAIKEYLEGKISEEKFKMVREPEEGDEDTPLKLVKPKVAIGNIPHANFSLYGATDDRFYQAPYILIGYESAAFRPDDEELSVLIQGCAYTAKNYDTEGEDDINFPDNEGVLDITQMLERIMYWMQDYPRITFPAGMEFTLGNYGTQAYTYPYNFGFLTFQIKTNVGARPRSKNLLRR